MGYRHLSMQEREHISRGLAQRLSLREIGRRIGRASSTICREVERNGRQEFAGAAERGYMAYEAQRFSWHRGRCPRRPRKLACSSWLRCWVRERLRRYWSPQQIAARLRLNYPGQPEKWVSHQTIYYSLEVMPRGELKRELLRCLRLKTKRGPRSHKDWIPEAMSIHNRPAEIEPRRVPGHWEGDLIIGRLSSSAAVGTLVERTTRYVTLVRMPTRDAYTVYRRFAAKFARLPAVMRKTMTYDRGREMAEHERLATKVGIEIYFADPHSPWQRGSNENTNGLLRQYLPKGMELANITQADLERIAKSMNNRPRKTLGFLTPNEAFAKLLRQSVALRT